MIQRPPISTRKDTHLPNTTLVRSATQNGAEKTAYSVASETAPKPAATPATISDAAKEVAKTVGEAALPIAKAVAPIAAGLPPETAVRAALDLAGPTRQNSELQITPPARSLASTKREGPLFDQARSFPKVQEPVRDRKRTRL